MSSAKPHYLGHRARLKERLHRDATQLADYEILELVLGLALARRDTKPVAKDLLQRFGSIRGVLDASPDELAAVSGIGPGVLSLWKLLRECMARYSEAPMRHRDVLDTPEKVAAMARTRLGACRHEEVWAALVDGGNRFLDWIRLDEGTVNSASIHIRNLMEEAVRRKVSGIILVHNHPGGRATPSGPDIAMTRRLFQAAHVLGIRLLDHCVITDSDVYSFQKEGLIDGMRNGLSAN